MYLSIRLHQMREAWAMEVVSKLTTSVYPTLTLQSLHFDFEEISCTAFRRQLMETFPEESSQTLK